MRAIAIAGEPATGKTTLVRRVFAALGIDARSAVRWKTGLLTYHLFEAESLTVLGEYNRGGTFDGTDRLSMAVAPQAIEILRAFASARPSWTILFEGDRLTGAKFLNALGSVSELHLRIASAPPDVLAYRHLVRGDKQTETFLRGRRTKVEGLRGSVTCASIADLPTGTDEQMREGVTRIVELIRATRAAG